MTIDWNRPIEAVHEDGRVVNLSTPTPHGNHMWPWKMASAIGTFYGNKNTGYICKGTIGDGWHIRNVKEEAVMETKFKVGDRVRHPVRGIGVVAEDDGEGRWPLRVDFDHGLDAWMSYDGKDTAICDNEIITLAADPDELTALRAFKAMALERYPDLEPKPETDEEAAVRFREEWCESGKRMEDILLAAIAWARANPRNTETKEG